MSTISIALDAMGGDHGPRVTVPAALRSLKDDPELKLILVGLTDVLQAELAKHQAQMPANLSFVSASQVVDMDEAPTSALRNKRDSSMRVSLNLVKEGVAQACVSAGNTGALMATARFVLKMLPGIDRPAIISKLPTNTGTVCILDLGANVDCTAQHLFQFAIMGSVMAEAVENISRPKVGLLNIGVESIKGNEVIKQAYVLLNQAKNLNFVGFIEGDDIYKGDLDVVVCDGFVGNVALKTSEGLANMIFKYIRQEFTKNNFRKLLGLIARPILQALKQRFDPGQYNGASFLGLRGIVVKSHGNANIDAFCNAIKMTKLEVTKNVPITIYQRVTDYLQGESKL